MAVWEKLLQEMKKDDISSGETENKNFSDLSGLNINKKKNIELDLNIPKKETNLNNDKDLDINNDFKNIDEELNEETNNIDTEPLNEPSVGDIEINNDNNDIEEEKTQTFEDIRKLYEKKGIKEETINNIEEEKNLPTISYEEELNNKIKRIDELKDPNIFDRLEQRYYANELRQLKLGASREEKGSIAKLGLIGLDALGFVGGSIGDIITEGIDEAIINPLEKQIKFSYNFLPDGTKKLLNKSANKIQDETLDFSKKVINNIMQSEQGKKALDTISNEYQSSKLRGGIEGIKGLVKGVKEYPEAVNQVGNILNILEIMPGLKLMNQVLKTGYSGTKGTIKKGTQLISGKKIADKESIRKENIYVELSNITGETNKQKLDAMAEAIKELPEKDLQKNIRQGQGYKSFDDLIEKKQSSIMTDLDNQLKNNKEKFSIEGGEGIKKLSDKDITTLYEAIERGAYNSIDTLVEPEKANYYITKLLKTDSGKKDDILKEYSEKFIKRKNKKEEFDKLIEDKNYNKIWELIGDKDVDINSFSLYELNDLSRKFGKDFQNQIRTATTQNMKISNKAQIGEGARIGIKKLINEKLGNDTLRNLDKKYSNLEILQNSLLGQGEKIIKAKVGQKNKGFFDFLSNIKTNITASKATPYVGLSSINNDILLKLNDKKLLEELINVSRLIGNNKFEKEFKTFIKNIGIIGGIEGLKSLTGIE